VFTFNGGLNILRYGALWRGKCINFEILPVKEISVMDGAMGKGMYRKEAWITTCPWGRFRKVVDVAFG
jgi:hypothetical protein